MFSLWGHVLHHWHSSSTQRIEAGASIIIAPAFAFGAAADDRSNGRNENLEKEGAANIDISEALSICSEQFHRSTHMPFSSYAEADPPFHRLPSRRPTPHPIIPSTGKIKRRSQSWRRRSRTTKAAAKRRRPTRSGKRSMPSGRRPRKPHSQCRQ